MSRYAKGRRAEHRSRALLEASGFEVIRSAGSKGPFDLIGLSRVKIVCVQVKSGGRLPSPAERETLKLFPLPPNARRLIHVWRDRERLPRVVEVA